MKPGILFVFALEFEAAGFIPRPPNETFVAGVAGAACGAALEKHLAARSAPPAMVVSAGLAGALDPTALVGALFYDDRVDAPPLTAAAEWAGFSPAEIHHTPAVLVSPGEKRAARAACRRGGPAICDMETEHIRRVCTDNRLPFFGLRSVSDPASAGLPVPADVLCDPRTGRTRIAALLAHLVLHPRRIPPFCRMVADAGAARRNLHRALAVFQNELAPTRLHHKRKVDDTREPDDDIPTF